jgi:CRISPR/Cas system CMR-associated protein Cmr5 small subunit
MDNLDQIRAQNALAVKPRVQKKHVTKLPALIVNNGLLAAAAFCDDKSAELRTAMDAVAEHLADRRIGRLTNATTAAAMVQELSAAGVSSEQLRLATAEALAYLSYLKRFAEDKRA